MPRSLLFPCSFRIRKPRPRGFAWPSGRIALAVIALTLTGAAGLASASDSPRCIVADNGSGSAFIPPFAPFGIESPDGVLLIRDGLPPGSNMLGRFSIQSISPLAFGPGGALGGEAHTFNGVIRLELNGTGAFVGFNRSIDLPFGFGPGVVHSAPRVPFDTEQSFDTDMFQLFGQVLGDPDFDLLRVTAGTNFGMPSPGHTTLHRLPGGDWAVDSFFDITYRIDFVGNPAGPLAGMSGSTTTGARLQEGRPMRPLCVEPSLGLTARFPSSCGPYASHPNADLMRDTSTPGSALTGRLRIRPFLVTEVPGGNLGGFTQSFPAAIELDLHGNGDQHAYHRTVFLTANCASESGPRTPGALVQGFPTDLSQLFGQIMGDPDFDLLRITAGTNFGMPSPGHTTFTQVPGGDWAVDSFFDITYRIDFVGAPGGPLAGLSGSTVTTGQFEQGAPVTGNACTVPDIGGTGRVPADCAAGYEGPPDGLMALNGLPPGSPLLGQLGMKNINVFSDVPGGGLGGRRQDFTALLKTDIHGTGAMAAFSRTVVLPLVGQSDTAPRDLFTTPQSIPTDMVHLQGQIVGDPDFDLLRVTAGTGFGMPSPGHTTLTRQGPDWAVDSFFDITYRVDFVGAPGGALAGMSGSTTAIGRIRVGQYATTSEVAEIAPPEAQLLGAARPNPTPGSSRVEFELAAPARVEGSIFDVAGRRVRRLPGGLLEAGPHSLTWDGHDEAGRAVPAGLYFYRVDLGGQRSVRRVVLAH